LGGGNDHIAGRGHVIVKEAVTRRECDSSRNTESLDNKEGKEDFGKTRLKHSTDSFAKPGGEKKLPNSVKEKC